MGVRRNKIKGLKRDTENVTGKWLPDFYFVHLERPMSLQLGCGMRALANQRRAG